MVPRYFASFYQDTTLDAALPEQGGMQEINRKLDLLLATKDLPLATNDIGSVEDGERPPTGCMGGVI